MNGVDMGEDQTLMIRWSKTISVKGSCLNQYEIKKKQRPYIPRDRRWARHCQRRRRGWRVRFR